MLKGYNSLVYPLLPLLNLRHQSFGVNDARSRRSGVGARVGQLRRLLLSELKQLTWRKALHDTATSSQSHGVYVSPGAPAPCPPVPPAPCVGCTLTCLAASPGRHSLQVVLNRWDSRRTEQQTAFSQMYTQLGHSVPSSVLRQAKRPWTVQFAGEGGQDVGGLFAEAMTMTCEELMVDGLGLFIPTPNHANA